jgi:hypothetical protein
MRDADRLHDVTIEVLKSERIYGLILRASFDYDPRLLLPDLALPCFVTPEAAALVPGAGTKRTAFFLEPTSAPPAPLAACAEEIRAFLDG